MADHDPFITHTETVTLVNSWHNARTHIDITSCAVGAMANAPRCSKALWRAAPVIP